MLAATYERRRAELQTYFDRTAADAWAKLTSDAPLGRIRRTVRAGRARMRELLLGRLPADLAGRRVLDAGCGTGALAMALAGRGADVVAVDLSPTLVGLARERLPQAAGRGSVEFTVGDMTAARLGRFDHVVAMDSLIHYEPGDMVDAIGRLAERAEASLLVTFAPRTPLLATMHAVGRLFPRGQRAPALLPVFEPALRARLAAAPALAGWRPGWSERVAAGFYTCTALEMLPS